MATLTEYPAGANHSFRSSLEFELTNLTEFEVTCTIHLLRTLSCSNNIIYITTLILQFAKQILGKLYPENNNRQTFENVLTSDYQERGKWR